MAILTPEQIERIRQIIRDGSTAVAVSTTGMEVSEAELERLVDEGYVDPDRLDDITLDAYEFGRLMSRLPAAKSMGYGEFRRFIQQNPVEMSEAERSAWHVARDRAGQFCVGLGSRYSGEVGTEVIQLDAELARLQREGIQTETALNIARRETVGKLKSQLGRIAEDWARDWTRIASTETQMAHQQGILEATIARHGRGEMMAKIPEPTACPDCERLYLGPDGRPIVRPAEWWEAQGASNVGVKRANWKAVLGAMHPWCQCQLVRVPAGMAFNDEWELVPEDELEKSRAVPAGTVHDWKTGPHRKKADGTWERVEVQAGGQMDLLGRAVTRVTEKDRQPLTARPPEVNIPEPIKDALDRGGYLIINSSGGKDSQAITYMLASHPELAEYKDRMVVLHADLGRAEWPGGGIHARKVAEEYGLRFEVTRRAVKQDPVTNKVEPWVGDMLTHLEDRAVFPTPGIGRFCTPDLKVSPLWKWIKHQLAKKGVPVVSALGIRREEGAHDKKTGKSRWFAKEWERTKEFGRQGGEDREAYSWNPILEYSTEDVWNAIRESGLDRHYGYDLGSSRLSCIFCPLANKADLLTSARAHPEILDLWIESEKKMRATHEARRAILGRAVADAKLAGTLDVRKDKKGKDYYVLRGEKDNAELRRAGARVITKTNDLRIPRRYMRAFLEFKPGMSLEDLRAIAEGGGDLAKSVMDSFEEYVRRHDRAVREYGYWLLKADELRELARDATGWKRAELLYRRSELLDQVARHGEALAGSHPFPARGERIVAAPPDLEKAREPRRGQMAMAFGGDRGKVKVLSSGGGLDSWVMWLMAKERGELPDLVIFADVGDPERKHPGEWPATYKFLEEVFKPDVEKHGVEFKWLSTDEIPIRAHNKECKACGKTHPEGFRSLWEYIEHMRMFPGRQSKMCTSSAKVERIATYVENKYPYADEIEMWIGYSADETKRLKKNSYAQGKGRRVNRYPLMESGICREREEQIALASGFPVPRKSACMGCPESSKGDFTTLYEEYPEYFKIVADVERNARLTGNDKRLKYSGTGEDEPWLEEWVTRTGRGEFTPTGQKVKPYESKRVCETCQVCGHLKATKAMGNDYLHPGTGKKQPVQLDLIVKPQKQQVLYLGPRGGKWADPEHTRHWEGPVPETVKIVRGKPGQQTKAKQLTRVARRLRQEQKVRKSDVEKARKLHYRTEFAGLPISIENRKGSYRYWKDEATGTEGRTFMSLPYGYIRLTEGADGDHVDCFLGPDEGADFAYVVHQRKAPSFKEYDEDKVMLGFGSRAEAKRAYLAHFDRPEFFGSMTAIPIDKFREQCKSGTYRGGKRIEKAKQMGLFIGPRGGKWADPEHKIPWKPAKLHERFGHQGAPAEGQKGHRPPPKRPTGAWDGGTPEEVALGMLQAARAFYDDPELGMIARLEPGEEDLHGFTRDDLPDLVGVPFRDGQGVEYTAEDRLTIAERMLEIAAETTDHWSGDPLGVKLPELKHRRGARPDWDPERYRQMGKVPVWVAAAVLADSMDRAHRKLRLVNVTKAEAEQFIQQHHSALPYLNPRGLMYAIGIQRGERLVAVATAGHPTGRALRGVDPRNVLELTRVASDGTTKNAASMLTGRLLDLLESSRRGGEGPSLFVTYQLENESGDTYRALRDKGLRPTARIKADKPHGARAGAGETSLAHVGKIRWEAGPAAGPAKWGLLERQEQGKLFKRRPHEGPLSRQMSIWEPAPHSKLGAERKKRAGGGYDYRYTKRRLVIGKKAKAMAAVTTFYLNVSGGGEKKRFVPRKTKEGQKASILPGRNLGAQIVAHEIPKTADGRARFAALARRQGLKLMIDSGEAGRFRKKGEPLDFDAIFEGYEAMADEMPLGTLMVVAPDKIADPVATAELRSKYAPRVKSLMERGVNVMVPLQARTADELGADYARAAAELGEGFIIGIPSGVEGSRIKPEEFVPFLAKLYESGRYPKVHFLGLAEPARTADYVARVVGLAYFIGRGVPRERALELVKSGEHARQALANVKAAIDALSVGPAQMQLTTKARIWMAVNELKAMGREEWLQFFADHPEDYDISVRDKERHFRELAQRLVQADAQSVMRVQMTGRTYDLETGIQTPLKPGDPLYDLAPKERITGTLDAYLAAREYQFEGIVPPARSGYEGLDIAKSTLDQLRAVIDEWLEKGQTLTPGGTYGGISGYQAGTSSGPSRWRPVGTMSMHGDPVRSPGDDPYVAQLQEEHPASPKQRKKREKKRRTKRPAEKKQSMVDVGRTLREVPGQARGADTYGSMRSIVGRDPERGREWAEREAEVRATSGQRMRKLTIRPSDLR